MIPIVDIKADAKPISSGGKYCAAIIQNTKPRKDIIPTFTIKNNEFLYKLSLYKEFRYCFIQLFVNSLFINFSQITTI